MSRLRRARAKKKKYFDAPTMVYTIPAIYSEFRNMALKAHGKMSDEQIKVIDLNVADMIKNIDEYVKNPKEYREKENP